MVFEDWITKILAFVVGLLFAEILSDFLVIKYDSGFKMRLNFEALNPFISHDKAIFMFIIELILIGVFTVIIENIFLNLIAQNIFYWLPIASLTATSLYILAIRRLNVRMNARRWLLLVILAVVTFGLFFLLYKLKNPSALSNH